MIIKIPVYFETELKISPDRVQEIQQVFQTLLTKDLNDINGKKFSWKVSGKKLTLRLLTIDEVKSRIMGTE